MPSTYALRRLYQKIEVQALSTQPRSVHGVVNEQQDRTTVAASAVVLAVDAWNENVQTMSIVVCSTRDLLIPY